IARTLAREFSKSGQLAATYFFRRGEKDRNSTSLFFSTIAKSMASSIPSFGEYLKSSLEDIQLADIETKNQDQQFGRLIVGPFKNVLEAHASTPDFELLKFIIIDAVDECEDPKE
ncbi:hypothetical protein B0T25DRAFT_421354, partial [Lasiosphaeria hispida]